MAASLVIVRHADTDWSVSGRHTGRTDLPLNETGCERAAALTPLLAGHEFAAVWSSPLVRASETARLAGFPEPVERDELLEWDYGEYEGLTTPQIRAARPGWDLWTDGCPGGEQAADVGARADALLATVPGDGVVIAFSHGHLLRVLTARWIGLPPSGGALLVLAPAGIGALGYEHGRRAMRALLGPPSASLWGLLVTTAGSPRPAAGGPAGTPHGTPTERDRPPR